MKNYEREVEGDKINAIVADLAKTDFQGADAEQHLLTAEVLINLHNRTLHAFGDQISLSSIDHLLTKAQVHIALANARR